MKILFYDTKKYDKESFDKVLPKYEDIEIEYVDSDISVRNAVYAKGFEAVCGFVSSDFSAKVIDVLADNGVKIILLRCAFIRRICVLRSFSSNFIVIYFMFSIASGIITCSKAFTLLLVFSISVAIS